MDKTNRITEYFADVETTQEHNGYFFSVGETLTIVILGTLCGLRNTSQIHQWAAHSRVSEFLEKYFKIKNVPCYYWFLCLLKIVSPKSLNQCFANWVQSFIPEGIKDLTLSFDGKAIRSTGKMSKYRNSLHIVSAHIAELGITFGQETVDDKSNEIPAVRNLIDFLKIEGCIVVADALHCQRDTARAVIENEADYLLSVKGNQETIEKDIADYVQDDSLRKTMDTFETHEKNRERIEKRTAFLTHDIDWLSGREEWAELSCIGAIHTQFTTKKGVTDEWHYYISSRKLTAEELLKRARLEWSVETMHWLLDVHFGEDFCRVEDSNVQKCLNIVRKIALNSIKDYKNKTELKRPISKIMLDCLLEPLYLLKILAVDQN